MCMYYQNENSIPVQQRADLMDHKLRTSAASFLVSLYQN